MPNIFTEKKSWGSCGWVNDGAKAEAINKLINIPLDETGDFNWTYG